jgi:UV DNA damage endonuclease
MHQMRVCVHPGQFCVLSSDSDSVVEKAFVELGIHGWLFDEMGLDHSTKWAINIHGGKADRSSRLIEQIKSLPDNVRKRLTLENDENSYSVIDLLEVYQQTGVPVVFDSHHHTFNDGELSMRDAHDLTIQTWSNGIRPLQHISNTEPSLVNGAKTDRRKHSDMIHYVPEPQLQALRDDTIDVEVEAKQKNLAVTKMATDFSIAV